MVESFSAITWEPLVRLIPNLEKAHPRVPGNIPGRFRVDRTGGRRETAVTDQTHTQTHRHTDTHTHTHTEITGIIDRYDNTLNPIASKV